MLDYVFYNLYTYITSQESFETSYQIGMSRTSQYWCLATSQQCYATNYLYDNRRVQGHLGDSPILYTCLTSFVVISKSLNHSRRPLLERLSNPMKICTRQCTSGYKCSERIFFFFIRSSGIGEMLKDMH